MVLRRKSIVGTRSIQMLQSIRLVWIEQGWKDSLLWLEMMAIGLCTWMRQCLLSVLWSTLSGPYLNRMSQWTRLDCTSLHLLYYQQYRKKRAKSISKFSTTRLTFPNSRSGFKNCDRRILKSVYAYSWTTWAPTRATRRRRRCASLVSSGYLIALIVLNITLLSSPSQKLRENLKSLEPKSWPV